jgi:hypothetical protein
MILETLHQKSSRQVAWVVNVVVSLDTFEYALKYSELEQCCEVNLIQIWLHRVKSSAVSGRTSLWCPKIVQITINGCEGTRQSKPSIGFHWGSTISSLPVVMAKSFPSDSPIWNLNAHMVDLHQFSQQLYRWKVPD